MDLNLTLTNESNYAKGFYAFVDSIKEAKIEKAWWNDMLAKVNELPSEVAFRKETDVRQKIVEFYINKIKPTPATPSTPGTPNTPSVPPTPTPQPPSSEDEVAEAKSKIKSMNMPNVFWQKIALELIEQYPEVAEYFNRM